MCTHEGLTYPKDTPDIIVDEALKHVPHEDEGYAYPLVEHARTDLYIYSMVVSIDCGTYMITFYNNQNYDDDVLATKNRIDFSA